MCILCFRAFRFISREFSLFFIECITGRLYSLNIIMEKNIVTRRLSSRKMLVFRKNIKCSKKLSKNNRHLITNADVKWKQFYPGCNASSRLKITLTSTFSLSSVLRTHIVSERERDGGGERELFLWFPWSHRLPANLLAFGTRRVQTLQSPTNTQTVFRGSLC